MGMGCSMQQLLLRMNSQNYQSFCLYSIAQDTVDVQEYACTIQTTIMYSTSVRIAMTAVIPRTNFIPGLRMMQVLRVSDLDR